MKNIFTVLTLIFIALKLMGYIAWSWFWVLSPIIIAFVVVILGTLGIIKILSK